MHATPQKNDAPILFMAEATCDPLIVANGKASSNSASKINATVGITCDIGFTETFSEATCKATSQGAAWDRIPTCAGRLEGTW